MTYQQQILAGKRKELGLTLRQVAKRAGMPYQQYQRFELGKRSFLNCSFIVALQICAALELCPYDVIRGREKQQE